MSTTSDIMRRAFREKREIMRAAKPLSDYHFASFVANRLHSNTEYRRQPKGVVVEDLLCGVPGDGGRSPIPASEILSAIISATRAVPR